MGGLIVSPGSVLEYCMDDRTLILSARATEPMQKDAEASSTKTKRR